MNTGNNLLRVGIVFSVLIVLSSLNLLPAQNNQNKVSKKQKEWFYGKTWMEGADAICDPGIDIETFAKHYQQHPQRWLKVFRFIHDNDLLSLPVGQQTLGDDVKINVQEYTTRAPGKELLEGHKKYIDLQYVVSGRELHGYAKLQDATETINPYSREKDIALFKVPFITYHVVGANHFTIFFPDDIHITNIQYGEKEPVRKVVFKIQVE
ncbi:MAG: YhcH/YjgK/YiaL family protein [Bacillus cereus]|jgi:YhcH/YjgK/YiaL family protein|nr:YhcH/YjgK/YiaL family protein [Bacillus cereus]